MSLNWSTQVTANVRGNRVNGYKLLWEFLGIEEGKKCAGTRN